MARKKRTEKHDKQPRTQEEKKKLLHGWGMFAIILVLIVIIGTMILSQFFDVAILSLPKSIVTNVITPIQSAFASGTNWVVDYLREMKYRSTLEERYNELLAQIDELSEKAMLADERLVELNQYKDLTYELESKSAYNGIAADVINREMGTYFSTFTINVGTNNGVEDFMAVIVPGALVGYTYNVTATKAQVRTIIDGEATVAAMVKSTRDQGMLSGTLSINGEAMCRMYYLPEDSLPRPGDEIITSGVGMEFPKGIPIGYVRESTRGMTDNKQYVVIEPIADFQHIETVIVLRYKPYAEDAQVRDVAAVTTYQPVATAWPVPTFSADYNTSFDVTQQESTVTPAPSATPTATVVATVSPTPDPDAPTRAPNLNFEDFGGTPTPEPTPSPTPTPTPKPTFNPDQMTNEVD